MEREKAREDEQLQVYLVTAVIIVISTAVTGRDLQIAHG